MTLWWPPGFEKNTALDSSRRSKSHLCKSQAGIKSEPSKSQASPSRVTVVRTKQVKASHESSQQKLILCQ